MNADQIKQQFPGYAGWNDSQAILADFKATAGQGKGGPSQQPSGGNTGAYSSDINQQAQQMVGMQQEAVKPAVQSLENQKAPLQAKYDQIIQSLKGQQETDVNAQQTALSQEYGKRGIPLSSGAFQQDLLGKTGAINRYYSGQEQQTGIEGQNALMDLASRIATLQSGAGQAGIQQALQQYQFGQNQQLQQAEQQRLTDQSTQEQALKNLIYQNVTLPKNQADIRNINSEITNRNTTSGGGDLAALGKIFGGVPTLGEQILNRAQAQQQPNPLGLDSFWK